LFLGVDLGVFAGAALEDLRRGSEHVLGVPPADSVHEREHRQRSEHERSQRHLKDAAADADLVELAEGFEDVASGGIDVEHGAIGARELLLVALARELRGNPFVLVEGAAIVAVGAQRLSVRTLHVEIAR
jgi:hypothetical protein